MQIRYTSASFQGQLPVAIERARPGRQDDSAARPGTPGNAIPQASASSRDASRRTELNASEYGRRQAAIRDYQDARQPLPQAAYKTRQAIAEYSGTLRQEERDRLNQMLGVDVYA